MVGSSGDPFRPSTACLTPPTRPSTPTSRRCSAARRGLTPSPCAPSTRPVTLSCTPCKRPEGARPAASPWAHARGAATRQRYQDARRPTWVAATSASYPESPGPDDAATDCGVLVDLEQECVFRHAP